MSNHESPKRYEWYCPNCYTCLESWEVTTQDMHRKCHQAPTAKCIALDGAYIKYGDFDDQSDIYDRNLKEARFAPLGDNHHNAAECPYCNPKYHEQAKTIERLVGFLVYLRSKVRPKRAGLLDFDCKPHMIMDNDEYMLRQIDDALKEAADGRA